MKISVIIPTYKREKDLKECLGSIAAQKDSPLEVIIIDNAPRQETERAVFSKKEEFKEKSIDLFYIKNTKENSLTAARNTGARLAKGEIVSFLDDDTEAEKDYFEKILSFFSENKTALGVSGIIQGSLWERNKIKFGIAQLLGRFFLLGFKEKKKCRVLPSLGVSSPMRGEEIIPSEWLSGASSYRKSVFEEFSFDENLKKYSWGEDTDFSYRLFKKYPQSLFFDPRIKYIHKLSKQGRALGKELVYMEEVYYLYLFYKIIPQSFKNKMAYVWGRIGKMVFRSLKFQIKDILFSFFALAFCFRNLRNIKKGSLDFFNKTLK